MAKKTNLTDITNSTIWTSTLSNAGMGYATVMLRVGPQASGILAGSITQSTASMIITLQAKDPFSSDYWRDVQSWTILVTEKVKSVHAAVGPLPLNSDLRLGCDEGDHQSGTVNARLAVS